MEEELEQILQECLEHARLTQNMRLARRIEAFIREGNPE